MDAILVYSMNAELSLDKLEHNAQTSNIVRDITKILRHSGTSKPCVQKNLIFQMGIKEKK